MRVALISTYFAEYASRLALSLSEHHAVQLHLTGLDADADLSAELRGALSSRVELHTIARQTRRRMLLDGASIARRVSRFRPDILHAQEAAPWTLWAARTWLGWRRPPFVLTVHDPFPHSGSDVAAWKRTRLANGWLRRSADAIVVHGASLVPEMVRAEPTARGHIFPAHHGILGDQIPPDLRAEPGSFLFFGRIEHYKGFGTLVAAAERLAAQDLAFRLVVAGRGPDLETYRSRLAALGARIELHDRWIPHEEVSRLFARADAVVLPYTNATQSGVSALAFNARKAIVATRVGALPEVIQDGRNGLLVPPSDPGALASAMARILREPGLRDALAGGAAETAAHMLSWDEIARETSTIYEEAVRRRRQVGRG